MSRIAGRADNIIITQFKEVGDKYGQEANIR